MPRRRWRQHQRRALTGALTYPETLARTIVDDTVGELSVVWNPYLYRWLLTYSNGDTSMREGRAPWGPSGDALALVSASDVPGLYAPYLSPLTAANSTSTVYFTLSVWDPYNVYWYKADLVVAPDDRTLSR